VTGSYQVLPVVALPGLRLEVLGNYLASLGLLRLLARQWPGVRIAWRDDVLQIVGGPKNLDELLDVLVGIAEKREWTPYERPWLTANKEASTQKSVYPLAVWQGHEASEEILELFCAHVVATQARNVNPLLRDGTFSNSRRVFSNGWKKAVDALAAPPPPKSRKNEAQGRKKQPQKSDTNKIEEKRRRNREGLKAYLLGEPTTEMTDKLNAASWFSNANKIYNSGQSVYREEPLSPWAMVLACEGLPFFAGASSRRLGAQARSQAAFPFISQAAAPTRAGEAGRDRGEVWAPIWERPMTLPEVRALFQRGRAEVGGRGATTPAAFAAAIVQRGVDAGISAFVRFALGVTTSANTFEPRHEGVISVPSGGVTDASRARSEAMGRILELVERLPRDRKEGDRWQFVGLCGPIEAALIRVAQAPDDPAALCELLDAVVLALDRVDRNVSHRKERVRWQPLPLGLLPSLFGNEIPGLEARLAVALASAFPPSRPFTLYRFGVEQRSGGFEHPESAPARWVYRPGPLSRVLADILFRSILDWEKERKSGRAREGATSLHPLTVSVADLEAWLNGSVDEALIARWLGRCALFDWRRVPDQLRTLWPSGRESQRPPDGPLLLAGLFQPLFDARPLQLEVPSGVRDVFSGENGARTIGAARTMAALIRIGQTETAIRVAKSRYALADVPLMRVDTAWHVGEPERLLAALLFPLANRDRKALVERWLRPQRKEGGYANA